MGAGEVASPEARLTRTPERAEMRKSVRKRKADTLSRFLFWLAFAKINRAKYFLEN